ncbi:MAG: dephospho-CoA kinase [Gloeobacteraceae cyanobacterium ES-bin-316]|nr:dephospho-CoA kinase [Ferruginibacter sp.]
MKIGLTGGIGSGKTTVAKIFETLGIPVYYADDAAKKIMNENEELRQELIGHFGPGIYSGEKLNRSHLASLIFNDEAKLTLLNSLVHPLTIADAEKWMQQQTSTYMIKEAALVFETDVWKNLDKVIGVSAPFELRLQRTMQRDGISEEAVQARMSKQMNEEEKMKRCDFILYNDEQHLLIPQVMELHERLLAEAGK